MGPRVVSLVPSWTETLIECGINVVGRTRYCIHPETAKLIPAVGGTKDISWKKVSELTPDLLIFDQEENPKKMADECNYPWLASHVRNLSDVTQFIEHLASQDLWKSDDQKSVRESLQKLLRRWEDIKSRDSSVFDWHKGEIQNAPGVLKVINHSVCDSLEAKQWIEKTPLYVIWKKPWMSVSASTFIGETLIRSGYGSTLNFESAYPQVQLEDFDPKKYYLMFSSEPYDFAQEVEELSQLKFDSLLVDGECFSWFGVRSLRFLEGI